MKQSLFISFLLILTLSVVFLMSCDPSGNGLQAGEGDIPAPSLELPAALVASETRTTDVPSDGDVFNPFRQSLALVDTALAEVYSIIDTLNANTIPDEGTYDIANGETAVISFDEARDYDKRITLETSEGTPYLQVQYNKGEVKGYVYFDVDAKDVTSDLDMVKVEYDETLAEPTLKGWATYNPAEAARADEAYALYFTAILHDGGGMSIEGGVSMNYFFDDDVESDGDTTNPTIYSDQHVYMFQAVTEELTDGGSRALCNLYFPRAEVDLVDDVLTESVDVCFGDILFDWVKKTENATVQGNLDTLSIRYDTVDNFVADLEAYSGTEIDSILFILDLDNPVAYNDTDGYVENGDAVSTDYTGIGNPAALNFTLTPAEVFALYTDGISMPAGEY